MRVKLLYYDSSEPIECSGCDNEYGGSNFVKITFGKGKPRLHIYLCDDCFKKFKELCKKC